MEFINDKKIKLEKPLTVLDRLVLRFIDILKKHADYVIVSGYVSILLGRSRSTEDVDFLIKPIEKETFIKLYHDLQEAGFWCLNAESDNEVYSYLKDGLAVRFAEKGQVIPNMEVKFTKRRLDKEVFTDFIEVETMEGIIIISSLERQIAFKRYYLKSNKDLEDAQHVESVFRGHINKEKIKKCKGLIESEHEKA